MNILNNNNNKNPFSILNNFNNIMSFNHNASIRFPPGTVSSKLSSRMLKKPPSPKDWMHQTYMEMIQDVSYATGHYYESTENGNGLLHGANKVYPETTHYYNNKKSATTNVADNERIPLNKSPLSMQITGSKKGKEKEELCNEEESSNNEEDDDDQSEECHTYTTSSTDYNRKNNIFRFYREQQNLTNPIDEESSIIRVVTPYNSGSSCCSSEHNNDDDSATTSNNNSSISINSSSVVTQETNIKVKSQKKKFKMLKHMMTKMKLAAEKPFWAIDNHF